MSSVNSGGGNKKNPAVVQSDQLEALMETLHRILETLELQTEILKEISK